MVDGEEEEEEEECAMNCAETGAVSVFDAEEEAGALLRSAPSAWTGVKTRRSVGVGVGVGVAAAAALASSARLSSSSLSMAAAVIKNLICGVSFIHE